MENPGSATVRITLLSALMSPRRQFGTFRTEITALSNLTNLPTKLDVRSYVHKYTSLNL